MEICENLTSFDIFIVIMRGLFDRLDPQDAFGNSFRSPDLDPVIGNAIAIVKFLALAEQGGEISEEQANRLGGLLYLTPDFRILVSFKKPEY